MNVLVLNAGSSTLKSHLYQFDEGLAPQEPLSPRWEGYVDWTASADHGVLTARAGMKEVEQSLALEIRAADEGVSALLQTLIGGATRVLDELSEVDVVGHRVVHGGPDLADPVLITAEVKDVIAEVVPLAPDHNPAELRGIESIETALRHVPQVAAFDTAFHRTMPEEAERYPLPAEWYERGVRRYGFHGISHRYSAQRAAQIMGRPVDRVITCHLGNGSSLAAVRGGRSVDTTMGFTPMEGLMMGSSSGSIDPGVILHLMRTEGLDPGEVNDLLNHRSGLLGVSAISSDLRSIETAALEGDPRAELAITMFVHRLRAGIGSMVASLGGVDALVFTAGIGEHSARIRQEACAAFAFLGLRLDPERNRASGSDRSVAAADSTVEVLVVHAREEWAIAVESYRILSGGIG